MPEPERGERRSSKIFAPIVLTTLLIVGLFRYATEESDKATRPSSPPLTSIPLAATAARETKRGTEISTATTAIEAKGGQNNPAATAEKEAVREPHPTTKRPVDLIRRGSSSIEANMGYQPRDPNKFVGKIVWVGALTACFRYQGHYICTALSPSLKGRVLIIGEDLIGDPGLKERIDSRCDSLGRMCPADVAFRFNSWELDMSGETMFIRTDLIHATKWKE